MLQTAGRHWQLILHSSGSGNSRTSPKSHEGVHGRSVGDVVPTERMHRGLSGSRRMPLSYRDHWLTLREKSSPSIWAEDLPDTPHGAFTDLFFPFHFEGLGQVLPARRSWETLSSTVCHPGTSLLFLSSASFCETETSGGTPRKWWVIRHISFKAAMLGQVWKRSAVCWHLCS